MDNDFTLEDLITQLGGPANAEPTPPQTDPEPPATDPAAPPAADPEPGTEPPQQQQDPSPDPDPTPTDKSQQAFIHMRQQNKKYSDTLKGIAGLLGLEGEQSNEEALIAALQTKITENEAKRNNVPVDLYQRLQTLEARDQEYTALQQQQRAALGFEQVKTAFNLSQDELNLFAQDLINSGKNPLNQEMNMVQEYRALYFERLVQKAKDEAVAAEQARSARASNTSSNPGDKNGNPPDTGDQKVSSVRELEKFFNAQLG